MFGKFLSIVILINLLMLLGCATPVPNDPEFTKIETRNLPFPDLTIRIPGLGPCTTNEDRTVSINSQESMVLLVHGCYGSAARFRALAQVFAFHGQQALCFSYNDRDSMMKSSSELVGVLEQLQSVLEHAEIKIIGHSQGGLIARKALIKNRQSPWDAAKAQVSLITISSPFSGIASASLCASKPNIVLTLGLALPICRLISGGKWYEITRFSEFIKAPGVLIDQVSEHLKIVTDEHGSCRIRASDGSCVQDDFVFSLEEQYKDLIDQVPLVENIELKAGHTEIVGDHRIPPRKLINTLQSRGIMNLTMPSQRTQFERLLADLY